MKVLFINSDQEQGLTASAALSKHACTVDWVRDVLSAQGSIWSQTYDLIVLDVKTLHNSDVQIADLVPIERSKVLLLSSPNWLPVSSEPSLICGCDDQRMYQPLTILELLAQVQGLSR